MTEDPDDYAGEADPATVKAILEEPDTDIEAFAPSSSVSQSQVAPPPQSPSVTTGGALANSPKSPLAAESGTRSTSTARDPGILRPDEQEALRKILEEKESDEGDQVHLSPAQVEQMMRSFLNTSAGDDAAVPGSGPQPVQQENVLLVQPVGPVSELLLSEVSRREAGLPTAMCAGASLLALGTSHGVVLLFEQTNGYPLRLILSGLESFDLGPVTALSLSASGEWLACGHARGQLVLWSVAQGRPVKTLPLPGVPGFAAFGPAEDSPALVADTSGQLAEVRVQRGLLFGTAVELRPLPLVREGPLHALAWLARQPSTPHPSDLLQLVALASQSHLFLLSLAPAPALQLRLERELWQPGPDALPYLAWRAAGAGGGSGGSGGSGGASDPVLAVGWGARVQLFRLMLEPGRQVGLQRLQTLSIGHDACGLAWAAPEVLLALNARDQLRVLDPFAAEPELERLAAKSMELVYSARAPAPPRPSFHHSVLALGRDAQVLLLGLRNLYVARVLSWRERVELLAASGRTREALVLARELYEGRARGAVGLPRDAAQRRRVVADRVSELLRDLCHTSLQGQRVQSAQEYVQGLQRAASLCVEFAQAVGRLELLFGEVFSRFSERGYRGVFLEMLEPFILQDRLSQLSPEIMQAFVAHYQARGLLRQVEQCLLHLEVSSLDFQQVVLLCRQHELWAGLVHVYAAALSDLASPAEVLLEVLLALPDAARRARHPAGLALLALLEQLSGGRAYPSGRELPPGRAPELRDRLLELLAEPPRRLQALLEVSPREAFRVLSLALQAPEPPPRPPAPSAHELLLRLADVAWPEAAWTRAPGSALQFRGPGWGAPQAFFFVFVAEQVARRRLEPGDALLQQVLAFLCTPPGQASTDEGGEAGPSPDERHTLLVQLCEALPPARYNEDKLLLAAEAARFFRVCELVHRRRRNWVQLVKSFLRDTAQPQRRLEVFGLLASLLQDASIGLTDEARDQIKQAVLQHLPDLVALDAPQAAQLGVEMFGASEQEHQLVLRALEAAGPPVLYAYLRSLLEPCARPAQMAELLERSGFQAPAELHERYIELMCELAPANVYAYLVAHSEYRLDHCLAILQRYPAISDAGAYLLERTGDVAKALALLLRTLEERLLALKRAYEQQQQQQLGSGGSTGSTGTGGGGGMLSSSGPAASAEEAVQDALRVAVALCQRNSGRLEAHERDRLWFALLDSLVVPLRKLKVRGRRQRDQHYFGHAASVAGSSGEEGGGTAQMLRQAFTSFIHSVLYNMMGHVSLPAMLEKIVRDHGSDEFADFKSIFLSMLENFRYERTLLQTATRLIQQDVWRAIADLRRSRARGRGPALLAPLTAAPLCTHCGRSFHEAYHAAAQAALALRQRQRTRTRALALAPPSSAEAAAAEPGTVEEAAPQRLPGLLLLSPCDHAFHVSCLGKATACPACQRRAAPRRGQRQAAEAPAVASAAAAQPAASASASASATGAASGSTGERSGPAAVGLLAGRVRSPTLHPSQVYLDRLEARLGQQKLLQHAPGRRVGTYRAASTRPRAAASSATETSAFRPRQTGAAPPLLIGSRPPASEH